MSRSLLSLLFLRLPSSSSLSPPFGSPRSQLGLHVRTVAMRSVLGSAALGGAGGPGGAAGALRQEFRAAAEASPCVLHVRGIASLAGKVLAIVALSPATAEVPYPEDFSSARSVFCFCVLSYVVVLFVPGCE